MMGERGYEIRGWGGGVISTASSLTVPDHEAGARARPRFFLHKAIFDPSRPIASIKMPIKRVLCLT